MSDVSKSQDELTSEVKAERVRYSTPRPLVPRRDIPRVVRQLTGRPRNPHEQTVRRWYTKGIAGVVLEIQWIGGEVFTTQDALIAFFEQVTAAKLRRHEVVGGTWQPDLVRERKVNPRLARMAQVRLFRRLGLDPEQELREGENARQQLAAFESDEQDFEVA